MAISCSVSPPYVPRCSPLPLSAFYVTKPCEYFVLKGITMHPCSSTAPYVTRETAIGTTYITPHSQPEFHTHSVSLGHPFRSIEFNTASTAFAVSRRTVQQLINREDVRLVLLLSLPRFIHSSVDTLLRLCNWVLTMRGGASSK